MTAIDQDTIHLFRRTSAATVSGRLFRRGFRNVFMRNVHPLLPGGPVMAGPAYTLRYIPAREDLDGFGIKPDSNIVQREAFEATSAGHILVMDCREEIRAASCGDILVTRLKVLGGAGLVTDGGVRDASAIREIGLPVFCGAPSPPVNRVVHHALEHGRPIACGGVAVYPGDYLVGDQDGVVVVPAHCAAEIAREAVEQEEMEAWLAKRVAAGAPLKDTFPPSEAVLAEYRASRQG